MPCALPPELSGGRVIVTRRPAWAFGHTAAIEALTKHFGTAGAGWIWLRPTTADAPALRAAGAILDYLTETQKSSLAHIDRLIAYRPGTTLELDESTRRSLELTRTLRDGRREGSLLAAIDRTVTAMGSRRWPNGWPIR